MLMIKLKDFTIIETGHVFLQYVLVFPAPGECMSLAQACTFTSQIASELLSYASLTTNIATAIFFFTAYTLLLMIPS